MMMMMMMMMMMITMVIVTMILAKVTKYQDLMITQLVRLPLCSSSSRA